MNIDELITAADPATQVVLDEPDSLAAARIYRRIAEQPPAGGRPRLRLAAGLGGAVIAAGVAAVVAVAVLPGAPQAPTGAQADAVLDAAAVTAAHEPAAPALGAGHYFYIETIETVDVGILNSRVTVTLKAGSSGQGPDFAECTMARQVWIAADMRIRTVVSPVRSRPGPVPRVCEVYAQRLSRNLAGPGIYVFVHTAGLPANPAALEQIIEARYVRGRPGSEPIIMSIASMMLQQSRSPAVRAALYRMLKLLPGMHYFGPATDRLGRRGMAIGLTISGLRTELIVDPATSALLEQFDVNLARGQRYCIPAHVAGGVPVQGFCISPPAVGAVIGYTLYVVSGVVHSETATIPAARG